MSSIRVGHAVLPLWRSVRARAAIAGTGEDAMTPSRWPAAVLAVLLVAVIAAAVWLVATTWETRDEIPQDAFLPNAEGDPFLMPGAHDATADVCDKDLPCRWAVRSETSTVVMFADQDDAKKAGNALPDARRSNWIVVQFAPGVLSSAEKDEFMRGVDGIYHSDD
jgi:hypothetical protein